MDAVGVLVADDNRVVRAVVRDMLDGAAGIRVVGEAANGSEALQTAVRLRPDVTLLDHRMPLRDGLSVVSAVSAHSRVLMLTRSSEDAVILAAVRAGAVGYLVHGQFTPAELVRAVHTVAGGEAHLSPTAARVLVSSVRTSGPQADRFGLSRREREVMDLIAQGLTNRQIADLLVLSQKTIENHVNRVFAKLDAPDRPTAVARWTP
jgi:DNA-binding NarL/FixJ family response regulator